MREKFDEDGEQNNISINEDVFHFYLFLGNVQTCDHRFCDCPYSDPNECIKTIDPDGTTIASSISYSSTPASPAPTSPTSPASPSSLSNPSNPSNP